MFKYLEESRYEEYLNADTMTEALEQAKDLLREGDWPHEGKTAYVAAEVVEIQEDPDGNEIELDHSAVSVRLDPPVPPCEADQHDWCSPHELLGGLEENPGVSGNGGGVIITEVCRHCGRYRVTNTWDQSQGPEPVETIEYHEADEASREWCAEQAILNAPSLDALVEALAEHFDNTSERFQDRSLVELPTFGGAEPEDTRGVWSWDENRLLIGEGNPDEWEVVTRTEWASGE
ncbi:hypothetical protein [Thioalkalivibrio sp. ALE20]|uniref:hypothetical protein n=1 Tax=Thioalkalivibrio sp. ALE20 TaxID=545275 RepID=UPI00037D8C38|nr:hypothetical protein [Thioalkalivibrio sp. ALE20]